MKHYRCYFLLPAVLVLLATPALAIPAVTMAKAQVRPSGELLLSVQGTLSEEDWIGAAELYLSMGSQEESIPMASLRRSGKSAVRQYRGAGSSLVKSVLLDLKQGTFKVTCTSSATADYRDPLDFGFGLSSRWTFELPIDTTRTTSHFNGVLYGTSGEVEALVVMDINVADFDGVALNQILEIIFSEELDPDSVRPETIQIRAGPDYGIQAPGNFRVDGNRVYFYPALPTESDLSDGGLQPGTTYRITIPGAPNVAVVRDYTRERTLARDHVSAFQTAVANSPDLFVDNFLDPAPPRVILVNPPDGAVEVPSNAVIMLTFNRRPLHPATVNADNFTLTMIEREGITTNLPIPGATVLSQTLERVTVVFAPTSPLADDAIYELTVNNRVEDLVGTSVPTFTSRFTIRDEP